MRRIYVIGLFVLTIALYSFKEYQAIEGWYLAGGKPENYEIGIEPSKERGGKVAFLRSIKSSPGFGTIMQKFSAKSYLGKRVRLTGFIKSKDVTDWAGMWFRIDGEWRGKPIVLGFDNMQSRPIQRTTDWKKYEIVLNVPMNSESIAYGVLLSRSGTLWIDDLNFEIVGKDVPVSKFGPKPEPEKPINNGFESVN